MKKLKRAKGKLIRFPRKEKGSKELNFSANELSDLSKMAIQMIKNYENDKEGFLEEVTSDK